MNPKTLSRLQDLKATASTVREAEVRLERARTELAQADLNLQRVQNARRAMVETLQRCVEDVVTGIARKRPEAETAESAEIVKWFTTHE